MFATALLSLPIAYGIAETRSDGAAPSRALFPLHSPFNCFPTVLLVVLPVTLTRIEMILMLKALDQSNASTLVDDIWCLHVAADFASSFF